VVVALRQNKELLDHPTTPPLLLHALVSSSFLPCFALAYVHQKNKNGTKTAKIKPKSGIWQRNLQHLINI